MEPIVVTTVVCPACRSSVAATEPACPQCGAALHTPTADPPQPGKIDPSLQRIVDNRLLLLALLFGVTAILGLPFLWLNRTFSVYTKVVLSIVLVLYTLLILWLFWLVMDWSISSIRESLSGPSLF